MSRIIGFSLCTHRRRSLWGAASRPTHRARLAHGAIPQQHGSPPALGEPVVRAARDHHARPHHGRRRGAR